jgi:GTP-sensing pleiotropic transcriptional regulator CodY
MDFFNEYLKGKHFFLYTDHKPLEKPGHLHSKTLNRLQTALLEHDFVIQYKKGSNMPADYLSRLLGVKETVASISAFDPFQVYSALLEHDFVIQYKKGSNMPADYLSRLLGVKETVASISAFDPFQVYLYDVQRQDKTLQMIQTFQMKNEWPPHLSQTTQSYYKILKERVFQDKNIINSVGTSRRFQLSMDGFVPICKVQERGKV